MGKDLGEEGPISLIDLAQSQEIVKISDSQDHFEWPLKSQKTNVDVH